jgi:hypothetical protein
MYQTIPSGSRCAPLGPTSIFQRTVVGTYVELEKKRFVAAFHNDGINMPETMDFFSECFPMQMTVSF